MLWTRDYKLSTVHVYDVVRAIWHLCYHGNVGDVYNLADKGDTSQSFTHYALHHRFSWMLKTTNIMHYSN